VKNLFTYKLFLEGRVEDYTNKLLDKISRSGIDSLSDREMYFLNSHKTGNQDKVLDNIYEKEFEDNIHGIEVKFIYKNSKDYGNFLNHYGTMIISYKNEYAFDGYISEYNGGFITMFENDEISDWDLFEGLEHEYEQFLEFIFNELESDYHLI